LYYARRDVTFRVFLSYLVADTIRIATWSS